ncbi:uncharacterized protein LOC141784018 [Sebastes fasciatus]|uniref:uncharacterized protein LOC141784018 n=1 Tax=Sebastes fasciatus TaxID=394691 RepID=UPI003D9E3947
MGDAQSAQRDDEKDAEAEEESGTVEDAPTIQHNIQDKSLKNKGQLSEINGKADSSVTELNGLCEEEFAAEAILSPDEDVSETEKPLKEEETPLENVEINEKESPNEADANEDVPLETKEMDAKQNDINESFRRFFSNIGFKLTVKRGSGDIATDVPDETSKEEPNGPEDAEDTAKETTSMNAEQNTALETYDNDSTTCPTLTDGTSEDILENAEEKTTETKEEVESDNADASTISPVEEDAQQDATTEEQPHSTSPSSPEEEEVISPIKRFFTTGIFSGLRKKKKPAEDETPDKELEDMGEKEALETTEQTVQDQQQDKEDISLGVEAAAVETEHREIVLKEEILTAATIIGASTIIVTEPEIQEIQILSSQEKDKVQASPLKRLLSGSVPIIYRVS